MTEKPRRLRIMLAEPPILPSEDGAFALITRARAGDGCAYEALRRLCLTGGRLAGDNDALNIIVSAVNDMAGQYQHGGSNGKQANQQKEGGQGRSLEGRGFNQNGDGGGEVHNAGTEKGPGVDGA